MQKLKVSRLKVLDILYNTKGKVFSCNFIKKDGTSRKMVARLGVKKNLKGGRNGAGLHNGLVTVYDMVKGAYRMVNLETITSLRANGRTYEVI